MKRRLIFPAITIGLAVVLFAVFHRTVIDWFRIEPAVGEGVPAAGHDHHATAAHAEPRATSAAYAYDPGTLEPLRRALASYEEIRAALAGDTIKGVQASATALTGALRAARAADSDMPRELAHHLDGAVTAAVALEQAPDLAVARSGFAELGGHLIPIAAADARLMEGQHVYQCPMTEGENRWLQPSAPLANPYKGQDMLTCGSEVTVAAPPAATDATAAAGGIAYYTCPMHTWVKQDQPGRCPVCSMDLTPVTVEEVQQGVIRIDHDRRQLIGVRFAKVERRPISVNIHAVGRVTFDETRLADVTLKVKGWIQTLDVAETGQPVRKGQTLFTLYSPELYAAQQDYLLAVRQRDAATGDGARARAEALVRGALQRLRLWDIGARQLERIAAGGEALQYLPIVSPAAGYVVEKNVVEGAAVMPGERLYRIAALDRVWVEAEVYEQDIPQIKTGQAATVSLSHLPGRSFAGKVTFVYPYLDSKTRTARVRVELPNPDLELKPDMYADVDIGVDMGERLLVPEPAIIYSGPRRIVFVELDGERLKPRVIETGVKSGSYYEVISGLKEGDQIVVSGNFLVSAESRLKSATGLW